MSYRFNKKACLKKEGKVQQRETDTHWGPLVSTFSCTLGHEHQHTPTHMYTTHKNYHAWVKIMINLKDGQKCDWIEKTGESIPKKNKLFRKQKEDGSSNIIIISKFGEAKNPCRIMLSKSKMLEPTTNYNKKTTEYWEMIW